jgi:hypothetical protein
LATSGFAYKHVVPGGTGGDSGITCKSPRTGLAGEKPQVGWAPFPLATPVEGEAWGKEGAYFGYAGENSRIDRLCGPGYAGAYGSGGGGGTKRFFRCELDFLNFNEDSNDDSFHGGAGGTGVVIFHWLQLVDVK